MDKAELLESLKCLSGIVEKSCSDDVTAVDAGAAVTDILDDTDVCCMYETVRAIVSAVTSYSDSARMSFAKCVNEDGWAEGENSSAGPGVCLKVAGLGAPVAQQAQRLYSGLRGEQKELLFDVIVELIPLLLQDGDLQEIGSIGDFVDESELEAWASDNGWKHPDKDSISDFANGADGNEVRDWVVEYIQDNL